MKKSLILCTVAVCGLALLSGSAATAADNWVGTWNLNVTKSKFKPGPALKSQTLKFDSTADGIKLTGDGVDADGKATITADVMVSKDGKTLTVTQTGKDAKGRVMDTVEVFDKQ